MSFNIALYRNQNAPQLIYNLTTLNGGSQSKAIMGDNKVTFTIKSSSMIYFRIGDFADIFNERYYIMNVPIADKSSSREYDYSVVMYADYYQLNKTQYMFYNENNELREGNFSLMGNPTEFVDKVVENANRVSSGWSRGEVIPGIYKNMTFAGETCLAALQRIANEYDTEYKIEGKKIHLAKRGRNTGITLQNGYDKGLYTIRREPIDNSSVTTRLYAFGSATNLPEDYRNGATRLLLPGTDGYIEKNVALYGIDEETKTFDDIFPHREGTVTSVNGLNVYQFSDNGIDFDVNDYKLSGVNVKVTFNTGQLAGYTFDVNQFNNLTKTFTILKNKSEKSIDIPSTTFKATIGDKYVLVDLKMPQSYIDAAEAELLTQATSYLNEVANPILKYTVTTDPTFMRKNNIVLSPGDKIWILDTELEVSRAIRINDMTRSFDDEYDYNVQLSDESISGVLEAINNGIDGANRGVQDLANQVDDRSKENNFVGDITIEQGTAVLPDMQVKPVGMATVAIVMGTDGKLYKAS